MVTCAIFPCDYFYFVEGASPKNDIVIGWPCDTIDDDITPCASHAPVDMFVDLNEYVAQDNTIHTTYNMCPDDALTKLESILFGSKEVDGQHFFDIV